jgi:hypothetical protein
MTYIDKRGKIIYCTFCVNEAVYSNGHTNLCESCNDAYEYGIARVEDHIDDMQHLACVEGVRYKD